MVPLPTQDERIAILKVHFRDKRIDDDVNVDVIARGTPGMSGADLSNLVNEAALFAVRRGAPDVHAEDFEAARDRVLMGLKRESMALTEEEKEVVAYHEGGHAVLAYVLEHADPVHKVTILPTGVALGVTQQLPVEERHIYKKEYITDSLVVRLGGRIAEELVYGHLSTGAQNDLVGCTELARKMVREWGMSDRLGPMAWGSQGAVFLGEDLVHTRDYSDETARVIDEEVERILRDEENRTRAVLTEYRPGLEVIARNLLEHETLDGAEVGRLIDDAMGRKVGGPRHFVHADGSADVAEPLPEGDSLSDVADGL
jgi:cell division protease FtsH